MAMAMIQSINNVFNAKIASNVHSVTKNKLVHNVQVNIIYTTISVFSVDLIACLVIKMDVLFVKPTIF